MDDFIKSFSAEFGQSMYPEDFNKDFEVLERIAHDQNEETLFVKDKKSGALRIAKCYIKDNGALVTNEANILRKLKHHGLPKYISEYENENILCVVREYIEGTSLDRYTSENRLSQEEIICIGKQLCDVLVYLHNETPPIIHRDIKPQNIIIDKNKKVRLIDFGISRMFDETAQKDTTALGTQHFAAPEQYGFSQTDSRTDIFSFGVLLGWLCTSQVHLKNILEDVKDKRLRRIIKKCTAFSPAKRYSSAKKVKQSLKSGSRLKLLMRILYLFLAGAVLLCAGFTVGRFTDWIKPSQQGISFTEPLIEQAVRLTLDIPEEQPIEEADLLNMTEIYIYGDRAAANRSEFEQLSEHMAKNDGYLKNGGISSFEDLAMMKNLRSVNIALEDIEDLSPLSALHSIEQLDLRHNPIVDLSPLGGLKKMRELCIYDTQVSSLSVLKDCSMLHNIDAGKTLISSVSGFGGIPALKRLNLPDVPLKSLAGIEEYINLEQLYISNVTDGDLSPLLKLANLREVQLGESLFTKAETSFKQAPFTITQLSG